MRHRRTPHSRLRLDRGGQPSGGALIPGPRLRVSGPGWYRDRGDRKGLSIRDERSLRRAPHVGFDGRDWEPIAPVPVYPGPRAVNGVVTDTGSVDGMLMLTAADTLRFTANIHHVAAPFVVTFQPVPATATPVTQAACG